MKQENVVAVIKLGYTKKQSVQKTVSTTNKAIKASGERETVIAESVMFTTTLPFKTGTKVADIIKVSMERGCAAIRNAFIALSMAGKKLPSSLFLKVTVGGKVYNTSAVLSNPQALQFDSLNRVTLSKKEREDNNVQNVANVFVAKFKMNIQAAAWYVTNDGKETAKEASEVKAIVPFRQYLVDESGELVNESADIAEGAEMETAAN